MLSPLYDAAKEKELINLIDNITQAIKDEENNPKHYFARALQYYQLSQQYFDIFESFDFIGDKELYFQYVNKAYDDIDKALSFNQPLDDYAYSFKLFMLTKLKRWEDLIEYGIKLEESIGLTAGDRTLIGEAFFHIENWQDCVDYYTAVVEEVGEKEANNIGVNIFVERGMAYSELEQYELAINDYKKHLELNKDVELCKYNIYGLMADAYEKLGNYEGALTAYSNLLKIDAENEMGYFRRGSLYCDYLHNYTLAVEDFERAISISQDNRFCYSFCAYAYVHKGEHDEQNDKALALHDYEKAIEYYKIAHKMEFGDTDTKESKDSYQATVGFAMLQKEELLKNRNDLNLEPNQERISDINTIKNKDYSEYKDIIEILDIEEPDLYDLEGIKNDEEYISLLEDSNIIVDINDVDTIYEFSNRISDLLEKHRIKRNAFGCNHRPIDRIAYEIIEDWGENISDYAKPYLRAMTQLTSIDEMYGSDSAAGIVGYFLANAEDYQGEKAERLKQELQNILDEEESFQQTKLF